METAPREKNNNHSFKWKGKPGYSGKGRPTFALLGKERKQPRVNKWKDIIPEYKGKGRPSHDLLVGHGFAKPKPKIMVRDGIRIKPEGVKWSEVIPEHYGRRGCPSHDLLVRYGFAKPKDYLAGQQEIRDDITPEFIIDKDHAVIEETAASLHCKPMGNNRKSIDPSSPLQMDLRILEKMETSAQKLTDENRRIRANAMWLEIAMKFESMGLFSSAALRFKNAGAWENAGHAFMRIKEYKQAAEAFGKAGNQDAAEKNAYMLAGKAAEKEGNYRLAGLMFSRGGHDYLASRMAKKEKGPC
ncbi:MAG: hypothetical protein NTY68_02000 [Candidatus Micrarchaeota archaeon]|nr:hypothetical protein [Candidatus Micrarchaeota archaeon]